MGTNNRIEQIIDEIYELFEGCRLQPLSQTKILVPKERIYDLLNELRRQVPDEIRRFQKIVANRDALIENAQKEADALCNQAKGQVKLLVSEHEVYRQAYEQASAILEQASRQAQSIRAEANAEAEQVRAGALEYIDEIFDEMEKVLSAAYENALIKGEETSNTLKRRLDVLQRNRSEIGEQLMLVEDNEKPEKGDDFDYDENQ